MVKFDVVGFLGKKWLKCGKCPIGSWAYKHVFYRGAYPAQVLFVGEGPGKSEDVLDKAILDSKTEATIGFTNFVACRPCDSPTGPNRPPNDTEVKNCLERLLVTIGYVDPEVLIFLGKTPQYYNDVYKVAPDVKTIYLPHPSYLQRCGGVGTKEYLDFVAKLTEVLPNAYKK
jgi:uracil-DNA glycosylase family 4